MGMSARKSKILQRNLKKMDSLLNMERHPYWSNKDNFFPPIRTHTDTYIFLAITVRIVQYDMYDSICLST